MVVLCFPPFQRARVCTAHRFGEHVTLREFKLELAKFKIFGQSERGPTPPSPRSNFDERVVLHRVVGVQESAVAERRVGQGCKRVPSKFVV